MQKYIAVVSPKSYDDEISTLIAKNIAGALFKISHQDYPAASELIEKVKKLSKQHNKPVSLIQDISEMEDPLDLEFGVKSGVDWVISDKYQHLKMAKDFRKSTGVIFKGREVPKGVRVDSVMAEGLDDPDAEILGAGEKIKHFFTDHPDQAVLDSLLHISDHMDSHAIAVSDIKLAKNLSSRRKGKKIIFAPKEHKQASKGAIYHGVHPIYLQKNLVASLKNSDLVKRGERVLDATNSKEVIHLVV